MNDTINHPDHYLGEREIEPIVIIEDWDLDFSLGNALKYIARAGRKDPSKTIEDLNKAIWYIKRHKEQGKFGITTIIRYNIRKWIEEVYTIEEVVADWDLSNTLSAAIEKIYYSRIVEKDTKDFYLETAISYIKYDIQKMKENG